MASNDDVSARLKALTAAIEKQNSRLDALEKKIAKKGCVLNSSHSNFLPFPVVLHEDSTLPDPFLDLTPSSSLSLVLAAIAALWRFSSVALCVLHLR